MVLPQKQYTESSGWGNRGVRHRAVLGQAEKLVWHAARLLRAIIMTIMSETWGGGRGTQGGSGERGHVALCSVTDGRRQITLIYWLAMGRGLPALRFPAHIYHTASQTLVTTQRWQQCQAWYDLLVLRGFLNHMLILACGSGCPWKKYICAVKLTL